MAVWLRILGCGLLCTVAIAVLKLTGRDGGLPLQWTGIVMLSGAGIALLEPVLAFAGTLAAASGVSETAALLLRALGVTLLTQLCADLCRQSGEGALGSGVEMAGKAELMLLCLPYLQRLVDTAKELLEAVP
jgi:stage III sporulation protein AD